MWNHNGFYYIFCETKRGQFSMEKGPIFTNKILDGGKTKNYFPYDFPVRKSGKKCQKWGVLGCFWPFLSGFCFTWNTTAKTNCSTWNIYFCTIFHPFGSVSHETPILLHFCYFQWNLSILWNVSFVWICHFSPSNWTDKWLIFVQNGLRNNLSTLILP